MHVLKKVKIFRVRVLEGVEHLVSRVISALNGVTLIINLLITNLLSPLPLQVGVEGLGLRRALG